MSEDGKPDSLVGQIAWLTYKTLASGELRFAVRVLSESKPYGVRRAVVTPVQGDGEATVNVDRLHFPVSA